MERKKFFTLKLVFVYLFFHIKLWKLKKDKEGGIHGKREISERGAFFTGKDEISANDIYEFLQKDGNMDMTQIQAIIMDQKRKKYLDMHPYSIYLGKDGKWYTTLPDSDKGRKKYKRRTRKEIEDIVIHYWKEADSNPTVEEIFHGWNNLRLERKKISKSTYDRYVRVFRRHFTGFGRKRIKDVEPEEVSDFLESEIARCDLTAKGFSNLKAAMVGILKRAKRDKLVRFNVADLLDDLDVSEHDFRKTIKEDYQEVYNEEELKKMIQYCMDNLDTRNVGILLMLVTGIRVGELSSLKHQDIGKDSIQIRRTETCYKDFDNPNKMVYTVKEFPKTKAGIREVAIPKDYQFLLNKMRLMNPFGEYVFVDKNGERLHTNAFRKRSYLICNKLGIYKKSPNKARKTVGTILFDERLDNNLIIRQMGWASPAVGESHYHRNRKSMEAKIEIISGIPEFQRK